MLSTAVFSYSNIYGSFGLATNCTILPIHLEALLAIKSGPLEQFKLTSVTFLCTSAAFFGFEVAGAFYYADSASVSYCASNNVQEIKIILIEWALLSTMEMESHYSQCRRSRYLPYLSQLLSLGFMYSKWCKTNSQTFELILYMLLKW